MMDIGTVLRGLYASEISGGFRWWGDNGFTWWIGAASPEDTYVGDTASTLDEAAQNMHEVALQHYPNSEYAKTAGKDTPPVRVLTPEMMEAVKEAMDVLCTMDDDGGHFYPAVECAVVGDNLRAAFGIEEG